jgi:hypothetical protein
VRHVVFNKVNSGSPFQQWKKGVSLAKGEWIWVAESDDYCEITLLDKLLENALREENTVLSFCQSWQVDETGLILRDLTFHTDQVDKDRWKSDFSCPGIEEIKKSLFLINSIPNASGVIFKKDAYLQADKNFERMKVAGDWMLWVNILKFGKIAYCAQPLNYFRTHGTTTRVLDTTAKLQNRLGEEYLVAKAILPLVDESGKKLIERRIQEAFEKFVSSFTRKEFYTYLVLPFLYKGPIPLLEIIKKKFNLRFSKNSV